MNAGNVAIIEDEFLVALQLEDILLDCGYSIVASVPDRAGAECIAQRPQVALVDLNLRDGLTGPEIARLLSERFGTRIIYVTANAGQIGTPADTAIGVIHKPFSREVIEASVAYALDESLAVPRPLELQPVLKHELLRSA